MVFDFTNGFHDAANSIATVIATGTLTPRQAVIMAAVCNFVVIFFITTSVAATVGKGIVNPSVVDMYVIFGALMGASELMASIPKLPELISPMLITDKTSH